MHTSHSTLLIWPFSYLGFFWKVKFVIFLVSFPLKNLEIALFLELIRLVKCTFFSLVKIYYVLTFNALQTEYYITLQRYFLKEVTEQTSLIIPKREAASLIVKLILQKYHSKVNMSKTSLLFFSRIVIVIFLVFITFPSCFYSWEHKLS